MFGKISIRKKLKKRKPTKSHVFRVSRETLQAIRQNLVARARSSVFLIIFFFSYFIEIISPTIWLLCQTFMFNRMRFHTRIPRRTVGKTKYDRDVFLYGFRRAALRRTSGGFRRILPRRRFRASPPGPFARATVSRTVCSNALFSSSEMGRISTGTCRRVGYSRKRTPTYGPGRTRWKPPEA